MKDFSSILTKSELRLLKSLNTPIKVQDFLDSMAINWEKLGETCMSACRAISQKKAHCIEGAFVAALALWVHGQKPLIMDLKTNTGDDHVIALYKMNGYWGAISKTNHATLRFRDPIFRDIHELALSYFHEYFDEKTGKKILYSYSKPFDLRKFKTEWINSEKNLFHIADALDDAVHYELAPSENKRFIRKADIMEQKAGKIIEWDKSDPRT